MPELPVDVWLRVAALGREEDISRLGRTCQTLLGVADSEIPSRGVFLLNRRSTTSFAAYLTHESRADFRASRVRRLTLHGDSKSLFADLRRAGGEEEDRYYGAVADILSRCTAVKHLSLYCPLLDQDERIGAAFAALRNIKRITLDTANRVSHLVPFLASMKSHCTHVDFQDYHEDTFYKPTIPVTIAFMASAKSLQSLEIMKPSFKLALVTFPCVTYLRLRKWRTLDLRPLVRCFPALKDLKIHNQPDFEEYEPRPTPEFPQDPDEYDDMDPALRRQANIEAFRKKPWAQLRRFDGSIYELHQLGISCPIQQLAVVDELQDHHDVTRFIECVTQTKPSRVEVLLGREAVEQFEAISWALVTARVTHLTVVVTMADSGRVRRLIDLLFEFTRAHGIVLLQLAYYPDHEATYFDNLMNLSVDRGDLEALAAAAAPIHADHTWMSEQDRTDPVLFLNTWHGLTSGDGATHVLASATSLKHLFLILQPAYRQSVDSEWFYWNADRTDGDLKVTKVSTCEEVCAKLHQQLWFENFA